MLNTGLILDDSYCGIVGHETTIEQFCKDFLLFESLSPEDRRELLDDLYRGDLLVSDSAIALLPQLIAIADKIIGGARLDLRITIGFIQEELIQSADCYDLRNLAISLTPNAIQYTIEDLLSNMTCSYSDNCKFEVEGIVSRLKLLI